MTYIGKTVLVGVEARKEVLKGVKFLGASVTPTIGPFGTNGLLEKGLRVTNDGISIAREISLDNEHQDMGLRKARDAAAKANDLAGDGSTTTITLIDEITTALDEKLGDGRTVGAKSTGELRKQLSQEKDEVIAKLKEISTPIETEEDLIRSAVVSTEDEELGALIGKAQWALGRNGQILAEETNQLETTIEPINGIRIDNGMGLTQAMNNFEKQSLELKDVPVILTTNTVSQGTWDQLFPIFDGLASQGQRNVVLVCRAISDDVIPLIQANAQKGFFISPINAPYVNQREIMKDLQAVLGGRFVDAEDGGLDTIQHSDLGHIKTLSAQRYTAIFAGETSEEATKRIEKRIEELNDVLKGNPSDFDRKTIEARIAQLDGGFALAKVGAESESERKRIFDKVEDACNAVRAAYQEGTVPGAGLAFKEIAEDMPSDSLLKKPLGSIYTQVMKNAPSDFTIEPWVRDPAKVLRIALEHATLAAGQLATISVSSHTKRVKAKSTEDNED